MDNDQQHISIKHWATEDKPREKLLDKGSQSLTNAELLAILINTGTPNNSALDIAKKVLGLAGQDLLGFAQLNYEQLKNVKGLGPKKAVTLLAAIELGRRGKLALAMQRIQIKNSREAFELLAPFFGDETQEHCHALFLDQSSKVIRVEHISSGGLASTVVDPRIIFRKALQLKNTTQIIVAHNHPSGNLQPSIADKLLTEKLEKGGQLLDLFIVDHLIIGHNNFYSFADNGLITLSFLRKQG